MIEPSKPKYTPPQLVYIAGGRRPYLRTLLRPTTGRRVLSAILLALLPLGAIVALTLASLSFWPGVWGIIACQLIMAAVFFGIAATVRD